jgi:hypothetical protein
MRLISAGLNGTSDSTVSIDYPTSGIICRIAADLQSFQKEH